LQYPNGHKRRSNNLKKKYVEIEEWNSCPKIDGTHESVLVSALADSGGVENQVCKSSTMA
jgi:hypothetical protein